MNLELCLLEKDGLPRHKTDMQEAFQRSAQEDGDLVLLEADIDKRRHMV